MTLTNYWWLLLWMFTGAAFLAVFVPRREERVLGIRKVRWTPTAAFLVVLPYIVWAGFRSDIYGDTPFYREMYQDAPTGFSAILGYVMSAKKDRGFSALVVIAKTVIGNSDELFFLLLALIQLVCIVHLYRKYSCNYWMSIFVFVAITDYMSWMHNGARQFIAVTIILASSELIIKKKYLPMILVIIFASAFHASALLMIPGMIIIQGKAWNKRTVLTLVAALIAILMIDKFTGILDTLLADTQYSNMVTDWKEWEDDGTNPIRVLVYSVPTILSLVGLKWIREENDPMINLATNASICSTALYIISMFSSGIFIGRLPIYFSLFSTGILFPWELEHMFTRDSKRMLEMLAVLAYSVFFYFQMHFVWGLM